MTSNSAAPTIGVLGERSLHAAIKAWYTRPGDQVEARVEGYFIDLQRGELLIEIQTGNFAAIRPKLKRLVEAHPVRLVHPIAVEKWILHQDAIGLTVTARRRSPKRGRVEDIFTELVRIPALIQHPNFSLEVLLVRAEQVRRPDGMGSWRRKGVSIIDQRLLEVLSSRLFETATDFRELLPAGLPELFTTRQLASAAGLPVALAQRMTYCLARMQALETHGKHGRAWLYKV